MKRALNGVGCEIGNGRPVHFILELGKRGLLGAAKALHIMPIMSTAHGFPRMGF